MFIRVLFLSYYLSIEFIQVKLNMVCEMLWFVWLKASPLEVYYIKCKYWAKTEYWYVVEEGRMYRFGGYYNTRRVGDWVMIFSMVHSCIVLFEDVDVDLLDWVEKSIIKIFIFSQFCAYPRFRIFVLFSNKLILNIILYLLYFL